MLGIYFRVHVFCDGETTKASLTTNLRRRYIFGWDVELQLAPATKKRVFQVQPRILIMGYKLSIRRSISHVKFPISSIGNFFLSLLTRAGGEHHQNRTADRISWFAACLVCCARAG
ncbi:unnamed protein product, partial [Ectocarpus sp. 13 AM-2016]